MPEPLAGRRAALAALAARLERAGAGPQAVWAPLARLTAAELLATDGPAASPVDLVAELAAVCTAVKTAVRRRPGWLCATLPPVPLPVQARPRLIRAAVLCVLAGAMAQEGPALVRCAPSGGAVLLVLRGGTPCAAGPAPALLQRLAVEGNGTAVFLAGTRFGAALRLPLARGMPKPTRPAEDLLADRYSLLYQFLGPYCAGPWL